MSYSCGLHVTLFLVGLLNFLSFHFHNAAIYVRVAYFPCVVLFGVTYK